MKRVLSVILVLLMVLSVMPAFAADEMCGTWSVRYLSVNSTAVSQRVALSSTSLKEIKFSYFSDGRAEYIMNYSNGGLDANSGYWYYDTKASVKKAVMGTDVLDFYKFDNNWYVLRERSGSDIIYMFVTKISASPYALINTALIQKLGNTSSYMATIKKVKLNKSSYKMNAGDTYKLSGTLYYKNYGSRNNYVYWTSSNSSVVSVNQSGEITAHKPGKATISAVGANGKKGTCKVTVNPITVKLNKKSAKLNPGATLTLTPTVSAKSSEFKTVTWTTSNANVATVDKNGVVKAYKPGKATITATAIGGKKATCKITVNSVTVKINTKKSLKLNLGQSIKVNATPSSLIAPYNQVVWKSAKPSVATVDNNGFILAVGKGKTTVSVTPLYGKKPIKITVTVK